MSRAFRIALLVAVVIFAAVFSSELFAQRPSKASGLTIFRFDTFADEQLWTDVLQDARSHCDRESENRIERRSQG